MWKHKLNMAIGGLDDIGFIDNSDSLVILSRQGIGILDCITGDRIYRSYEEWWPLFDNTSYTLTGIPGYLQSPIKIFGLHSDFKMRTNTADEWQLIAFLPEADEPPFEKYLVTKVYLADANGNRMLVAKDGPCELRVFGFAETDKTLVVATSCEVVIWV